MPDTKEYVVTFPVSYQITEDSWKVQHPALKVNSSTTMAEIEAFYRKFFKSENDFTQIQITELKS